jgi:Uma2 family endonuclease
MHATDFITRYRLTVDDYHRLGDAGVFREGEQVELIEGEIVKMPPIGPEHAGVVTWLNDLLTLGLYGKAMLRVQSPVRLRGHSEPQPDIAIVRTRDDYYRQAHPGPEDVLLIVEVADTTVRYDREIKTLLYASHGIPEVWLLDLIEKRLEVYHGPEGGEYRHVDYYRSGTVCPKAFPDLAVDLESLGWGYHENTL